MTFRMRHILTAVIGLICLSLHAESVKPVFLQMPDTLLPYFDRTQRMTLLLNAENQDTSYVVNLFGGQSRINEKRENYLSLQVAEGITYELLVKQDTICLVQTTCIPVCISVVSLYSAVGWTFLRTVPPSFDAEYVSASLSTGTLVFTDQTPLLLDEEEKKHYRQED